MADQDLRMIAELLIGRRDEISPNGQPYNTRLNPLQEMAFRQWQESSGIPFDLAAPVTDYDLRGYWLGSQQGSPHAAPPEASAFDGRQHLTDYWKTPLHQSFSSESQWANPQTAPRWSEDGAYLESRDGRIRFKEGY